MPLQSSATRPHPSTSTLDDGPVLECAPPGSDVADHLLRIRARRLYVASPDQVFATWTRRAAWESWMRLRARSRATLAPYPGGSFRLELAEGPTIHVISGSITDLRAPDHLSLRWVHHNTSDHGSIIDVAFQPLDDATVITLVHRSISSRREAAWLMRLWATALDRLGHCLSEQRQSVTRVRQLADRLPRIIEPDAPRRAGGRPVIRGASSAA
jgi:uncharacterized protein YndB with AHSA1/START domain